MIDTVKKYTIDGKDYTVVRTSAWYNDETTIEYWLYLGAPVRIHQLEAIGTVDNALEDDDDEMPIELAVKVALNRYSKRPLSVREDAEWTLIALTNQEVHAVRHVAWAKQEHEAAVRNVPHAQQAAEEAVARALKAIEHRENRLAELRVQIADANVLIQNG